MRAKARSEPGERREVETVVREEKERPLELLQQTSQGWGEMMLSSVWDQSTTEASPKKIKTKTPRSSCRRVWR